MNPNSGVAISVVVPVYRSGRMLEEFVQRLTGVLEGLGRPFEVLLSDDNSPDHTWEVIKEICRKDPRVRGYRLMANEGQPKSTLCGLAHAAGEIVATMDDDFQHDPDDLPKLIQALEAHPEMDCVIGAFEEKQHRAWRNWGSLVIRRVVTHSYHLPAGVRSTAFRAMRRPVVDAILAHRLMSPSIPVLLYGSTQKVMNVTVRHAPRRDGRSNYTLSKLVRQALDNICYSSMLPLRMISVLGAALCALSFLLTVYFLAKYLLGVVREPGWTTLVLLITFFSGSVLLALGVIGEYMVRILREVRVRPMFFVRETAGGDGTAPSAPHGGEGP